MTKSHSVRPQLDALFQAPLAEFTRSRDAQVAVLRQQGKAGPAAALKALKKPSVSAWTVNQLFFREPEQWAKLQAAGSALRRAYATMGQGGAGDSIRQAQKELGRALELLRVKARAILQRSRQKATQGMLERIGTTLHALAVREPDDAVVAGQLVADVDPPGFEALAAALGEPPAKGKTDSVAKAPDQVGKKPESPLRRAVTAKPPGPAPAQKKELARAARLERERLAQQRAAQSALRTAARELAARTRELAAATRKVAAAERALTAAAAAGEKARQAEKAAQQAVAKAQSAVDES